MHTLESERLISPAYERNIKPILNALATILDKQALLNILEVGSGPGQHALAIAKRFSNWTLWPSEPSAQGLASIKSYRQDAPERLREPVRLELSSNMGSVTALEDVKAQHAVQSFDAVLAINVLHMVGEPEVKAFFRLAYEQVEPLGYVVLYECLKFDGRHHAPSNAAFDEHLRAISEGRVYDIAELDAFAAQSGFTRTDLIQLPANNHLVVYKRR